MEWGITRTRAQPRGGRGGRRCATKRINTTRRTWSTALIQRRQKDEDACERISTAGSRPGRWVRWKEGQIAPEGPRRPSAAHSTLPGCLSRTASSSSGLDRFEPRGVGTPHSCTLSIRPPETQILIRHCKSIFMLGFTRARVFLQDDLSPDTIDRRTQFPSPDLFRPKDGFVCCLDFTREDNLWFR